MQEHDYCSGEKWDACYNAGEVRAKLKELLVDMDWLLDYSRRVAAGQVKESDPGVIKRIREDIKFTKKEFEL